VLAVKQRVGDRPIGAGPQREQPLDRGKAFTSLPKDPRRWVGIGSAAGFRLFVLNHNEFSCRDREVGKDGSLFRLGSRKSVEGPSSQTPSGFDPQFDKVRMDTRARDPDFVQPESRRMVVGTVEPARQAGQIASLVFDLCTPSVSLAWLQACRKRHLDPGSLDCGWRTAGSLVDGGLGLGHRLVEIEGQFLAVG